MNRFRTYEYLKKKTGAYTTTMHQCFVSFISFFSSFFLHTHLWHTRISVYVHVSVWDRASVCVLVSERNERTNGCDCMIHITHSRISWFWFRFSWTCVLLCGRRVREYSAFVWNINEELAMWLSDENNRFFGKKMTNSIQKIFRNVEVIRAKCVFTRIELRLEIEFEMRLRFFAFFVAKIPI